MRELDGETFPVNHASTPFPARMQIDYYDAAHRHIETKYGGAVRAPDNSLNVYSVDLDPFEAPNVFHVHVSTTTETATPDLYQVVGTAGFDI